MSLKYEPSSEQTTRVFYSTATDGFQQAVLALNEGAFLANGNYPVVLQVLNLLLLLLLSSPELSDTKVGLGL